MEECAVSAHDQMILRVICTRPVNPHVRSASCRIRKGLCEAVAYFAPYSSASHNDLYILRELLIVALSVVHIFNCTERKSLLQIRVFLAHLCQPVRHIVQKLNVVVCSHISSVVGQNCNLPYAGLNHLLKFCLHNRQVFLIMLFRIKPDCIIHKCVKCIHKPALGSISRVGERLDQRLDLLVRIKLSPVGVMLRIILRRIEIRIQFIVSAPCHQVNPVFC